ncbi:MAG: hypothetical protein CSA62_12400 [Planctomycetota bacterium]|nr:MAG: hypothetical protein CSA62_12400 [Planctomycetota bacterium]
MVPFPPALLHSLLGQIVLILGGILVLWFGAESTVRSASRLALRLGMSPMLVGATVVAFGTSAPEWLVTVFAQTNGAPDMALTNILGSNVANLSLVLGLTTLILPLAVRRSVLIAELSYVLIAELVFLGLAWNLELTATDGLLLFGLFAVLYFLMFRSSFAMTDVEDLAPPRQQHSVPGQVLILLLGVGALAAGADAFTTGAQELGRDLGVSDRVLGATVVAFGTSLPELVTCVVGAIRGHSEISLGNLLGSNLFNILFVGGSLSLIGGGVQVPEGILSFECLWVLGITAALWPLTILPPRRMQIGRGGGFLLTALWVVFATLSVFGSKA